jgi:REP element-mobilizing transposase RayT
LARPLRITFPGAVYHVTSRGNERKPVFNSDRDREKFLEYLESATKRYQAMIHVYCLMDNHYHLLLETPAGNLPQIMRHINGAYTTYFNVKRQRSGHLFQGRYKAILVDMDTYAKELSRYIHLNPVRAKMVETPEAYEWSSYSFYIGKKKAPEWLHRDFILGYFGNNISAAQRGYMKFVTAATDRAHDNPLNGVIGSTLLGSPEFVTWIKENFLSKQPPDKTVPALNELADRISLMDIFHAVDAVFGDNGPVGRNVKMFLCQKHTGEKLKDIGACFGIGESAVSQACRRVRGRIVKDQRLKGEIEKIEAKLSERIT